MSVFISYRRDGGKPVAEAICDALYKEYDVFLDTKSLGSGHFDSAIVEEIKKCSDFVMLITETVFNRCAEPDDWIFHEAKIALAEHKNIIPIFVGITSFPGNVPGPIKEICRFNGIFWSDKDATCPKLKSFLVSNRRYVLSAVRNGKRIGLDEASKEDLKELYRRFTENGRSPTEVQIRIQDAKDMSLLLLDQGMVDNFGTEQAERFAEQSLLQREKGLHRTLETAVEYMLQDEILDTCSVQLQDVYVTRYGIPNCFFRDKNGLKMEYWTPFMWIDIIEELLKQLLYNRYYVYANSKDFLALDCFLETHAGKEIWSFCSFIPKESGNPVYEQFMDMLNHPGGHAACMQIPLRSLAFYVYPDFYASIGALKTNQLSQSFDEVAACKNAFNLCHYFCGLH